MLNISLQSEYIVSLFGVALTNTFVTSLLVTLLLGSLGIFFFFKQRTHENVLVNGIRILIYELLLLTDMVTQERELSKKILPLIATFFLFIITANLLALIPGFFGSFYVQESAGRFALLRSPNSDLTTTLALALFSVLSIQFFSFHALGMKRYVRRFLDLTGPIKFLLGFFEMLSEGVKILSFSFRLFGNVFAGEILLLVIAFLIPYIIPLPFMFLEVFVGIVQAFIFSMLTLVFIKTSTIRHVEVKAD